MSNTFKLDQLQVDNSFTKDLMLDDKFVLLPANAYIDENLLKCLKEWNFDTFLTEGEISLYTRKDAKDAKEGNDNKGEDLNSEPSKELEFRDAPVSSAKEETNMNQEVLEALEEARSTNYANSEKSRYEKVQSVYHEYMKYINKVYTYYATHKKIDLNALSDTIKDLCVFIKENKRYVLRISPSPEARNKNFLVTHSMRSTVLAITMGLELHMPFSKLIELGITSLLHEIGMLRLPPQLYMTDKVLSSSEKSQVSMHPLYGYKILKELDFPLSIQLGVLEHHEKVNGQGYPRRISGESISTYAKIVSIACTFEAITAPRSYKSERSTFEAMVEMLKNPNGQYDPIIIKALLYSLSLYPIGAYVYLKNGKVAVVVDVSPTDPKNPIVQLQGQKNRDGSPITLDTSKDPYRITRVLSKAELDDVLKSLKEKEAQEEAMRQERKAQNAENAAYMNAQLKNKEINDSFNDVDLEEFN